jgi:acyl transferase domain-containing protein
MACGSNAIFTPESGMSLGNLGMLGKDSRCFSFDHRANGYARGEGFGVLLIKPLDASLRDGDTIRAVIRSSCSNQDGRTPGVTQPSQEAQRRLILDTYAKAGLTLGNTRYFEAHGTGRFIVPCTRSSSEADGIGTPMGDPIEAGAIGSAFREYRSQEEPLYV